MEILQVALSHEKLRWSVWKNNIALLARFFFFGGGTVFYAFLLIHGSSYFKLPRLFQWLTGNIGFHHAHHLNPLVPNYKLEACHKDNAEFEVEVKTLTLKNFWETMKLKFWDEKSKRIVRYRDLKKMYLKV